MCLPLQNGPQLIWMNREVEYVPKETHIGDLGDLDSIAGVWRIFG